MNSPVEANDLSRLELLGTWDPPKGSDAEKEIHSEGPKFVFLCETKLLVAEMRLVASRLDFNCCLDVDCDVSGGGCRGGLGLLCEADSMVVLRSFSPNHIDVTVGEVDRWIFTGCYGFPEEGQKWKTWRLLERLVEGCDLPRLCAGDFNETMCDQEKCRGATRRDSKMRDFRHRLDDCGLTDLRFVGHSFTWTNKQAGQDNIQERLDRGLANHSWLSKFPNMRVSY